MSNVSFRKRQFMEAALIVTRGSLHMGLRQGLTDDDASVAPHIEHGEGPAG